MAVLSLGGAVQASAQDAQYWNIQYGPVAQLLGGQVVGSTRDLSATYYNPGGLGLAREPGFLFSVQGFKADALSLKSLDGGPLPSFSQTTYATFPGFVAVAFPRRWFGENTQMAFSLLTRQQHNERVDVRLAGDSLPSSLSALSPGRGGRFGLESLFDQRMRETWGGLTFSRRLSDRVGLGATLFGVHRGQRTRREESLQLAYADGSGVSALVIDDFNYTAWRLLGKVGLAWEGGPTRLGLAVTSPSAGVFGNGKAGFTRSAAGANLGVAGSGGSVLVNGLDEHLDARYRSSWAVAGGASWQRRSVQVHASAEWFAPVDRFTILSGLEDPSLGTPITLSQELRSVLNVGVGAEYWLHGVRVNEGPKAGGTALYGAFATDLSASPDVVPGEAASANQNWYHFTAGTAFGVGSSRFSLGIDYAFGRSEREIAFGALPPDLPVIGEGRRVAVRSTRWLFVLGYLFGPRR